MPLEEGLLKEVLNWGLTEHTYNNHRKTKFPLLKKNSKLPGIITFFIIQNTGQTNFHLIVYIFLGCFSNLGLATGSRSAGNGKDKNQQFQQFWGG